MSNPTTDSHLDYPTAPLPVITGRTQVNFNKPAPVPVPVPLPRRATVAVTKSALIAAVAVVLVSIQVILGDVVRPALVLLCLFVTVVLLAGSVAASLHGKTVARLSAQAMLVVVAATQVVIVLGALPHPTIQVLNLAIFAAAFWALRDH